MVALRHLEFAKIATLVKWPISARQFSQIQDGGRPPFWKKALSPYLSCEWSDLDQIWFADANFLSRMDIWNKKIEIFHIQDGGRTPYWKSFLAISRRLIGWSTRNSERRWRIACQYKSSDQNCNFPKFKMAEGRHFENSFRCLRHSCNELMLSIVFQ